MRERIDELSVHPILLICSNTRQADRTQRIRVPKKIMQQLLFHSKLLLCLDPVEMYQLLLLKPNLQPPQKVSQLPIDPSWSEERELLICRGVSVVVKTRDHSLMPIKSKISTSSSIRLPQTSHPLHESPEMQRSRRLKWLARLFNHRGSDSKSRFERIQTVTMARTTTNSSSTWTITSVIGHPEETVISTRIVNQLRMMKLLTVS